MSNSQSVSQPSFAVHGPTNGAFVFAALVSTGAAILLLGGAKWVAVLLVVAAVVLAILSRPETATLVVAFLIYTNAAVVAAKFHGVPRAVAGASVLLMLLPLAHRLIIRREKVIIAPAVPLLFLLMLVQLVGALLAKDQVLAVRSTVTTLTEGMILYLLVTNVVRTRVELRHIVWTLLFAGTLLGGLSVFQQATRTFHKNYGGFAQVPEDPHLAALADPTRGMRAAGPIGEKNYYAQFMLMLLPLALVYTWSGSSGWPRAAAVMASVLIGLAIALTASRGAAVGFIAMLLTLAWLRQVRSWHLVTVVVATSFILFVTPQYRERLISLGGLVNVVRGKADVRMIDRSTQGRLTEMLAATLVFCEHPVFGVGPGNFPHYFLDKADALGFQVHAEQRMAHCSYLEIAAENGALGLLLYLAILFVTLRELLRVRRNAIVPEMQLLATAFFLAIIVMMSTGFFLSFAYERYYWFVLALAAAVCQAATRQGGRLEVTECSRRVFETPGVRRGATKVY